MSPKFDSHDLTQGVRVFVSSTFRDMQAERNELVRHIFPVLRRWCEERGIVFTEIDLRWGLTTSQASEGLVLPICLEEIDRCRPFFIGLLGNRYGWIEPKLSAPAQERFPWLRRHPGVSLTELEMIHGAFNSRNGQDQVFFYLRDPCADPADTARESDDSSAKLQMLRQRARDSGRAHAGEYRSAQQLGAWILQDLQAALRSLLPAEGIVQPAEREQAAQRHFTELRNRVYVGTCRALDRLSEHYLDNGAPLMITGEFGSGKSTLAATWHRLAEGRRVPQLRLLPDAWAAVLGRLRGHEPVEQRALVASPEVLVHLCIGITAASSNAEGVARSLLRALNPSPPPSALAAGGERSQALAALPASLQAASRYHRVCLLLDGLDHFPSEERGKFLAAFPEPAPAGVRVVFLTGPCDAVDAARRRGWQLWELPPWPEAVRRLFVQLRLADYGKKLEPSQEDLVVRATQTGNPIFLQTVLEELRVASPRGELGERLGTYLEAAQPAALFAAILPRWEADLEGNRNALVGETLSLLWVARHGLVESELRELLGGGTRLPDAVWSPLAITLAPHLVNLNGHLVLERGSLRLAAGQRYLADTADKLRAHGALADYFEQVPVSRRMVEELIWHLVATRRWHALARWLAQPAFLKLAWGASRDELLSATVCLERFSGHLLPEILAPASRDDEPDYPFVVGSLLLACGHLEAAGQHFREAEKTSAAIGDLHTAAEAAGALALIDRRMGRIEQALQRLESLEDAARRVNDWPAVALHLGMRGEILRARGQADQAWKLHEEEYAICRRLGDEAGAAAALGHLGALDFDGGRHALALARFGEQGALCQRLGDLGGVLISLGNQATALARLGEPEKALALHREETRLARLRGDRWALQVSLGNQAGYNQAFGFYDTAMQLLDEKEEICCQLGSPEPMAKTWLQLSQLLSTMGQREAARGHAAKAEALARQHGLPVWQKIKAWSDRLN